VVYYSKAKTNGCYNIGNTGNNWWYSFLASGIAAIAIAPLLTNIHIATNTTQE
jgi:hypothetical protein